MFFILSNFSIEYVLSMSIGYKFFKYSFVVTNERLYFSIIYGKIFTLYLKKYSFSNSSLVINLILYNFFVSDIFSSIISFFLLEQIYSVSPIIFSSMLITFFIIITYLKKKKKSKLLHCILIFLFLAV